AERLTTDKREARDIDRDVAAGRIGRKIVEQPAAGELKARFIDLIGADGPYMLRGNSSVSKRLLRRSGEGVLSEVLGRPLRVDLNSRHRTWAGAATQHQMVRIV